MLVELSIVPLNGHEHMSGDIAEVINTIEESGLDYELTPTGTCIEGDWNEVMETIRECHQQIKEDAPHVLTHIKIDDEDGVDNKLERNVKSVETKL